MEQAADGNGGDRDGDTDSEYSINDGSESDSGHESSGRKKHQGKKRARVSGFRACLSRFHLTTPFRSQAGQRSTSAKNGKHRGTVSGIPAAQHCHSPVACTNAAQTKNKRRHGLASTSPAPASRQAAHYHSSAATDVDVRDAAGGGDTAADLPLTGDRPPRVNNKKRARVRT